MAIISPAGVDLAKIDTSAEYTVGQRATDSAGGEFVYCSFAATSTAKNVVSIDEAFAAADVTTTTAGSLEGQPVGVTQATMTAASFGWVRIYGPETGVNSATGNAANAQQATTATAGRIDDAAGVGTFDLLGLSTTGAEASNAIACFLNYPRISEVAN